MANHQHALVRYVTLDRCLSRHRLTKEELIARCSEAVSNFTGDYRQLSERTFFNDLQALRDGIILGRCASIICTQGRYAYEVQGRSLFMAGDAEVERLARRLALMEERVQRALGLLRERNAPPEVLAEMRDLLLGDGLFGWVAGQLQDAEMVRMGRPRGMMGPLDALLQEPAFKRRGIMERKEDIAAREPSIPGPDDGRAADTALPPEGDVPTPTIVVGEISMSSTPPSDQMQATNEGASVPRRRRDEVSNMLAEFEPDIATKIEAEEVAFGAIGSSLHEGGVKPGLVSRFFQRLRLKRLLWVVRRVVG